MKCNPDDYREDLANFDMTTEQEDELLFTLWEMMRTFAEMGQGVQSINNIFPIIFDKADPDSGKMLEQTCRSEFNK